MKRLLMKEDKKDITMETDRTTIVATGGCAKKELNTIHSSNSLYFL